MLRLAREYTLLPCKYINVPRDAEVDFLLTMALDIHDKELLCSACGGYKKDCQDPDADGHFAVADDTVCYRTGAGQLFQKDNPDLEPGTLLRVVDTRITTAPVRTQHNTQGRKPQIAADETLG